MSQPNRAGARGYLASLLSAALHIGEGAPNQLAAMILDYQAEDFGGASPVVTVTSGGSGRSRAALGAGKAAFYLNVHIFVKYSDESAGWTEQMAETRLDTIEGIVADVVFDNKVTGFWKYIDYASERSEASGVMIGGVGYRREAIPLRVDVY